MKITNSGIVVMLFTILIVLGGCKGRSPASDSSAFADSLIPKEVLIKEVFNYPLPTAFEVTSMLVNAKAPCIIDLCNPPSHASQYINQARKALNLGVYGADLCYTVVYNQNQETMNYMNVTRKIAEELNLNTSFNVSVAKKIEDNLTNKDTLIRIISNAFYDSYNELMQNKQDKLSALVMAGSWIEAMYITSQIYLTADNKDAIASILVAHGNSLNKLLEILHPLSDDSNIAAIYNDLLLIQKEFLKAEQKKTTSEDFSTLINLAEKTRLKITG